MRFRKKPVVVEAEQFLKDKLPYPVGVFIGSSYCSTEAAGEWCELHQVFHLHPIYKIKTLEGDHIVSHRDWIITHRDWIITGVKGEKSICKPDEFALTYEPVEE